MACSSCRRAQIPVDSGEQGCIRREGAPEAVRSAVGGGFPAVGGGYCRSQMPSKLALAVREAVAGHRLGALEGRGGSSNPTQHAKGRAGDCPGPRKEATTGRNVTQGVPPPLQCIAGGEACSPWCSRPPGLCCRHRQSCQSDLPAAHPELRHPRGRKAELLGPALAASTTPEHLARQRRPEQPLLRPRGPRTVAGPGAPAHQPRGLFAELPQRTSAARDAVSLQGTGQWRGKLGFNLGGVGSMEPPKMGRGVREKGSIDRTINQSL